MQEIIQIASEIYMIVLCLVVGATGQTETRIDQVSSRGLMNTVIAQRNDQGFTLYDERRGRRIEFMTLLRKEDKPGVFVAKGPDGEEETLDVSSVVDNLGEPGPRRRSAQVLRIKGGGQIQVARSGSVTYLTENRSDRTYVVHGSDLSPSKGQVLAAEPLNTKIYRLLHSDAAQLANILRPIIKDAGEISADERTRSLIISASEEKQHEMTRIIEELDVEVPRR